jgi:hypothetical protein
MFLSLDICVLILHTSVRPVANFMPCSLSDKPQTTEMSGLEKEKKKLQQKVRVTLNLLMQLLL